MKRITKIVATTLLGIGLAYGAAQAEPGQIAEVQVDPVEQIMAAGRIEALMQIVATEGARHGLSLEKAFFTGQGGKAWARAVSAIQTPERLVPMIAATLREELSQTDARTVARFLSGDLGSRIVKSEVNARRDMLDGLPEDAIQTASSGSAKGDSPIALRAALIDEIIDHMGLVDSNVSGGLNANYAFYRGLGDGGALRKRLTEREMLAMVWNQEPVVRRATAGWLRGYLTFAYAPFSDAELRDYLTFTRSPAGRRYTSAMFAGFGRVFERTSYDLGRAAARFIIAEAA